MTKRQIIELYNELANKLETEGYEADVRGDYSGRWMYGRTAPAIVTDATGFVVGKLWAHVVQESGVPAPIADRYSPDRQDSMGLSKIYYGNEYPGALR